MELVHPPTPLEVLQFGNPSSWHREDVNGICEPPSPAEVGCEWSNWTPTIRFYNLGVPHLEIDRM